MLRRSEWLSPNSTKFSAQFEIFLAIPVENVDHPQAPKGENITHGVQVIPFGQDLLAILNALCQQFQFGAAPDDIGVAHVNVGITVIFAHFQGVKVKSIRFFHSAGIEQGGAEPDIKASHEVPYQKETRLTPDVPEIVFLIPAKSAR